MSDYNAVARPYARAVFELAQETGRLKDWSVVLATAAEAARSDDVVRLLAVPGIDAGSIASVIAEICRREVPDADGNEVANLLAVLAENDRLPALGEISDRFEELRAEVENVVDVVLTAATQVDEAQQSRIAEALKKRFGKEVNLQFKLDESLIGGARLQADDLVIYGSVSNRLEKMASALVH